MKKIFRLPLSVACSFSIGLLLGGCGSGSGPVPVAANPSGVYRSTFAPLVSPTPTPHAQTYAEGVALENQMAREAEEKAKHEKDPANQVKAEQEKIERQIQESLDKAEGDN